MAITKVTSGGISDIAAAIEGASDSNKFTDADHSKLNAIEASATADQTDAQIRAAVEAASDSNVFTDADHSKLNAIEASADVTDATNVTAAGALMDSEVTNLSEVKAFDSSAYATAAQGTLATNALPKAGGTMTGNLTVSRASGNAVTRLQGASNSQSSKLFISHTSSGSGGLFYNSNVFDIFSYGDIRINSGTGNVNDTIANERIVIKNTGLVGIGTSSPSKTLSVHSTSGSAGTPNGLYIYNEVHGSDSQIYMYAENDSGSNQGANIKLDPDAETFSFIGTGGQTAITINDSAQTTITGSADMQLTTKSAIGTAAHEAGGGFSNVGHATQGSRRAMMWLDADGANFGGSDYYYIEKTGGGGVQHILQNSADMKFATGGTTRMNINSNGNIGIAENTPIRKFHIVGPSGNGSTMLLHMDADTAGGECGIEFKADSTNDDRRIKAAIKYRRDDPGTRGTGNLHFCVNGDNNDVNVTTSHSRMMLNTDGLHFNGDTAAANALDDYEEGTYAYTITGATSGSMTPRSGYNHFAYTKIGRLVTVQGRFETSGSHTASGQLRVSLPFSSHDGQSHSAQGAGVVSIYRAGANFNNLRAVVFNNSNYFVFYYNEGGTGDSDATVQGSNVDATMEGSLSITYMT